MLLFRYQKADQLRGIPKVFRVHRLPAPSVRQCMSSVRHFNPLKTYKHSFVFSIHTGVAYRVAFRSLGALRIVCMLVERKVEVAKLSLLCRFEWSVVSHCEQCLMPSLMRLS